ncbi:MAG: GYD domain-containing protein [Pseudomonadota bacterium]
MPTFVMMTRLSPGALQSPQSIAELERGVADRIRQDCPEVEWVQNLAILGPYDYVDIFRAPDLDTACKVSALVRSFGHAHTEVWSAVEWSRFKEILGKLKTKR